MKVDGVTGSVVHPSTYLGWIAIEHLTWPGVPPHTVSSTANGSTADSKGVFPDYPDFSSNRDVRVRAVRGRHSAEIGLMVQQGSRTSVDIRVPMPHNKLVKAQLTKVFITHYNLGNDSELITFTAESGKLRAAP